MTRAFVTGITGFTGGHLATHLTALGWTVAGFARDAEPPGRGALRDRDALGSALDAAAPEIVFHLAGLLRADAPEELYEANVTGTVALLEALVARRANPVVVVVSSSAVYGSAGGRDAIHEGVEPRPRTHYGASKLAQEVVARRYADAHGMRVVIVRPFNLLGPGLSEELACGGFAARIARLERDGSGALRTGNLDAERDFTDVRDAVRAYTLLAQHGVAGEAYNVCSQRAVSIRRCVDMLVELAARPIATERDPALLQSNDVPIQIGDATRLSRLTGWRPETTLERSLEDMLEHCRRRLR